MLLCGSIMVECCDRCDIPRMTKAWMNGFDWPLWSLGWKKFRQLFRKLGFRSYSGIVNCWQERECKDFADVGIVHIGIPPAGSQPFEYFWRNPSGIVRAPAYFSFATVGSSLFLDISDLEQHNGVKSGHTLQLELQDMLNSHDKNPVLRFYKSVTCILLPPAITDGRVTVAPPLDCVLRMACELLEIHSSLVISWVRRLPYPVVNSIAKRNMAAPTVLSKFYLLIMDSFSSLFDSARWRATECLERAPWHMANRLRCLTLDSEHAIFGEDDLDRVHGLATQELQFEIEASRENAGEGNTTFAVQMGTSQYTAICATSYKVDDRYTWGQRAKGK
ncbi:hypothetical protein D5086_010875 [Populus alba]|uniref:Uncharacterized protein n=1 Tax=Populus alba TaxID=43335 RepID=A0ACC4CBG6_POPAL